MEPPDAIRDMHVLVVDDEPVNLELLERILATAGFTDVETTTSGAHAVSSCDRRVPDIILLDLHMPGMDGYAVMHALGPAIRTTAGPPVLVLTADATLDARRLALAAGARDFISKPFDQDEVLLRVRNLLELRSSERAVARHSELLEHEVRERTAELEASRLEVLDRLALVAEYRDDETNVHARRIGRSSLALAQRLSAAAELLSLIEPAAALHDIGKVAVRDAILNKPGRLTADEFAQMKAHTTIGARMLAASQSPVLQLAERIALTHHERWDGTGYPNGLAGELIPLEGRIVAVADVFDALTHQRPYKRAWSATDAAAEIRAGAGSHFDPAVVAAFASLDPETLVDPRLADAGMHVDVLGAEPPDAIEAPVVDLRSRRAVLRRIELSGGGASTATRSQLDRHALDIALDNAGAGRDRVLVSISASSLCEGVAAAVLGARPPAADSIVVAISDPGSAGRDEVVARVGELRALGCQVAVEDFGDVSLQLACACRLEYLILSPGLWDRIEVSPQQQLCVRTLTGLADGLGARLVVGPVRTPAQLETLTMLGVDVAWGPALAPDAQPAPAATLPHPEARG